MHALQRNGPCRVGLVVSLSASHTVGRGFASRPGHTKDQYKNGMNCLPALQASIMKHAISQFSQAI